METVASFWTGDPADLRDLGQRRDETASCVWGTPPPGFMWAEQLSPHLQRNKQLQDTLLQREEELVRLQEENNKLREFLNSSFVRNLEQKAKRLTADGRRKLKRNLTFLSDEPPSVSQQVTKRVCRNLTAEFCSESSGSEPNLDLWVLRTLGLKDRDTIDTSHQSSEYDIGSLVYDSAAPPSSSPEDTVVSASSTASSVHSFLQRSTHESNSDNCDSLAENCSPASGLTDRYDSSTAFTASSRVQTQLEGNPTKPLEFWSSMPDVRTPSRDMVQFSPPAERLYFSPVLASTPIPNQPWTPVSSCSPSSPSAASQPPATPRTPLSRTDLAFSMSLSPSSSVKTHSFPQGQAFVRKDTEGRWNFTWVPRQGP